MKDNTSINSELSVISKIETIVCNCVNEAVGKEKLYILPKNLYKGISNIPFPLRIARGAVFVTAHDRFGVTYKELSIHSHLTCTAIMRCARVYKNALDVDNIAQKTNELIDLKLKSFPII